MAAAAWMGIGLSVWAMDIRYSESVFVTPTARTVSLAPSYLVSSSYVAPTAYVVPSYYSTASVVPTTWSTAYVAEPLTVLPTTYVATSYRRGLFGRRWLVERPVYASYGATYLPSSYIANYATSYVPSAYVLPTYYATSYRSRTYTPTVYEYPVVWETGAVASRRTDCDEVAWAPTLSSPSAGTTSPRTSVSNNRRQIESREDPTIPSNVDAPASEATSSLGPDAATNARNRGATRADTPPAPPRARQEQIPLGDPAVPPTPRPAEGAGDNSGTVKSNVDPAAKTKAATPTAPGGDQKEPELAPAPPAADNSEPTFRRDARRPAYASRPLRPDRRNVLIGKVENSSGDPQDEVPVSVTSRSNSAVHHDGLTNAFGGFAIRLTDGEWTVNVTMPSGRVYPVRTITVNNGKVMDNQEGREVHNLIISY